MVSYGGRLCLNIVLLARTTVPLHGSTTTNGALSLVRSRPPFWWRCLRVAKVKRWQPLPCCTRTREAFIGVGWESLLCCNPSTDHSANRNLVTFVTWIRHHCSVAKELSLSDGPPSAAGAFLRCPVYIIVLNRFGRVLVDKECLKEAEGCNIGSFLRLRESRAFGRTSLALPEHALVNVPDNKVASTRGFLKGEIDFHFAFFPTCVGSPLPVSGTVLTLRCSDLTFSFSSSLWAVVVAISATFLAPDRQGYAAWRQFPFLPSLDTRLSALSN
jgi:hypothetical protein